MKCSVAAAVIVAAAAVSAAAVAAAASAAAKENDNENEYPEGVVVAAVVAEHKMKFLSPRFMNFAVSVPRGGGQAISYVL